MPWQLIYTSAPRGLLSGQSGFCTVARSAELREALVQRLEQISSYHYLRVAEANVPGRNPTISVFRILDFRGSKYHVLTRIQPCGLDFTGRTNHLAHHLVFQTPELGDCPSPAMILRHWSGWRSSWEGEPRLLENPPVTTLVVNPKPCLPAQTWFRMAGDAGKAAGLLESDCLRGCTLVCPPGSEQSLLEMFCETLQLLNLTGQYFLRPWRHPFTTFLQAEDNPADFQWRGCQEGTPAYQQALQRQTPLVPLTLIRVPNNSLVKVAREGLKPPPRESNQSSGSSPGRRRSPGNLEPPSVPAPIVSLDSEVERAPRKKFALGLRVGIFIAVLVSLILIKYWHERKNNAAETEATPPPSLLPSAPEAKAAPIEPPAKATPDEQELTFLSTNGPTYIFPAANLTNFSLPIDSIIPFKRLINNFEALKTLGRDIQLSFNTDQWDFQNRTPLIVAGRKGPQLVATNETGEACLFDYSNWHENSGGPVQVVDSFSRARAFSVHFGFSSANDDPFRLLIVNQNAPPSPLRLNIHWLNPDCEGVMASVRAPLGERLMGGLTLLNGAQWQLQPFIKKGRRIKYLYSQWPTDELPPNGDELDFAEIKKRVAAGERPIKKKLAALEQNLEQQQKAVNLNLPLGRDFQLTNNLVSFSTFAGDGDSTDFIKYLNKLKKHSGIKKWPLLSDTDSDEDLAQKFHRLYDLWVNQVPDSKQSLSVQHTNYFYAAWRSLNLIEKIEQDEQHAGRQLNEMEDRVEEVPATLDQVAYVGLVIVDSSGARRGLEMIRFEQP